MKKMVLPPKAEVASVDVHTQNTFTPLCPNELPVPEGDRIVDELNTQAQFTAKRIGTKEAHSRNAIWLATQEQPQLTPVTGANVDVRWVAHSIIGTQGFQLIAGLPDITDYDYFVWQGIEPDMHPYGVCYHDLSEKLSTGLIEYLRVNKINTVIVGGLATDYCVKTSVLQLLKAQFTVVVNLGACRGIASDTTQQAKQAMLIAGAQFVESAAQLVNAEYG